MTDSERTDARRTRTKRPRSAGAARRISENAMLVIWRHVLGVDRLTRDDNFFELGGSSMLAALLTEEIAKATHKKLTFDVVFEHPTIARLCAHLRSH